MATKRKYHYQNLSLKNIKGEVWDDVPGLDGYFSVSNMGRIKREERETLYKDGRVCVRPERILKPTIVSGRGSKKKMENKFLTVRLCVADKRYNFTIARLVYHCFVQPIDLDNHKIVIICKDTDNFNIRTRNLHAATLSEKAIRVVERNRFTSNFVAISPEKRKQIRQKIVRTVSKQISQYDKNGRLVRTYSSMSMAERKTGVHQASISSVARGKKITAGGYFWRFGKERKLNIEQLINSRRDKYIETYGLKLTQFNMEGKIIAHHRSVLDAALSTGVEVSAIYQVLLGRYKSTKGFFWQKGYAQADIDLSNHKWGHASRSISQQKSVRQISLDGKLIAIFPSIKSAAEQIKVSTSTLNGALKGKQKTCKGYHWQYVNK